MTAQTSPLAGKPAPNALLVDMPKLISAYYTGVPDPGVPAQRVAFGTSGHRGSSFNLSFNEWHVLAITQAICQYRQAHGINGPLFLGMDTHALSQPAYCSALEVLAANGIEVMLATNDEYTPTPAVSHAILTYNRSRTSGLADGIIVTPSHNPPDAGGFKYNPPNGGPASTEVTDWIEAAANQLLDTAMAAVRRVPLSTALRAQTTHRHDFLGAYVDDIGSVIDLDVVRNARVRMGVDPLGGAGVHYWARIAERYKLDLTVVSDEVDPSFRFMSVDWDGKIRMDPSSPYAMQRLQGMKGRFDIAFACDTDHDRHGIVTPQAGLMPPNHYLAVATDYLLQNRPRWATQTLIGKTVVSTSLIDRVAEKHGHRVYEVPVGFKWFSAGLLDGSLGFCGEESAGATFLRRDGTVWTTDKDGLVPALLAAEIIARCDKDLDHIYSERANEFGNPVSTRVEAPASVQQKKQLAALKPSDISVSALAGHKITAVLDHAPGNGAPIGGIKVVMQSGWFAARPSGTEDIYKIYAESFSGTEHLRSILKEAKVLVDQAMGCP